MTERDAAEQAAFKALEQMVGMPLRQCRTKEHVFQMLRSALHIQSSVHNELANSGQLTLVQGKALEFAGATIGAIVRTIEASPLYETEALADQLVHSLRVHLGQATARAWEPKDAGGEDG